MCIFEVVKPLTEIRMYAILTTWSIFNALHLKYILVNPFTCQLLGLLQEYQDGYTSVAGGQFTFSEHLTPLPCVRVALSLVFCGVCCRSLFVLLFFGLCVVCSSSTYCFPLPLRYLLTLLRLHKIALNYFFLMWYFFVFKMFVTFILQRPNLLKKCFHNILLHIYISYIDKKQTMM